MDDISVLGISYLAVTILTVACLIPFILVIMSSLTDELKNLKNPELFVIIILFLTSQSIHFCTTKF